MVPSATNYRDDSWNNLPPNSHTCDNLWQIPNTCSALQHVYHKLDNTHIQHTYSPQISQIKVVKTENKPDQNINRDPSLQSATATYTLSPRPGSTNVHIKSDHLSTSPCNSWERTREAFANRSTASSTYLKSGVGLPDHRLLHAARPKMTNVPEPVTEQQIDNALEVAARPDVGPFRSPDGCFREVVNGRLLPTNREPEEIHGFVFREPDLLIPVTAEFFRSTTSSS